MLPCTEPFPPSDCRGFADVREERWSFHAKRLTEWSGSFGSPQNPRPPVDSVWWADVGTPKAQVRAIDNRVIHVQTFRGGPNRTTCLGMVSHSPPPSTRGVTLCVDLGCISLTWTTLAIVERSFWPQFLSLPNSGSMSTIT